MEFEEPRSKLVWCSVPTGNADSARSFYGALFGSKTFERLPTDEIEAYYRPISADGIDFRITSRQHRSEHPTCFFAVDSVDEMTAALGDAGGEVVFKPRDLRNERGEEAGRMAIVLDPDGNAVGLMELPPTSDSYFRLGEFRERLSEEQRKGLENGYRRET